MKLSIKMTLLFTFMMLVSLFVFTHLASQYSISGANAFTQARFRNMSTSIERDLDREFSMMEMTLQELTVNTTFTAALNQLVRDDSADPKMRLAASNAALQQLLQSSLVDMFYRVSFYTPDGIFLTSRPEKDASLVSGSAQAQELISSLIWLDKAKRSNSPLLLGPHSDIFSPNHQVQVYSIVQPIQYHGNFIGYLEVSRQTDELLRLMEFIDNDVVSVEIISEDGRCFFDSRTPDWIWKDAIAEDSFTIVETQNAGKRAVYYKKMPEFGLHLYISQSNSIEDKNNSHIRSIMSRYALFILIPSALIVMMMSLGLTRSIRKLTKKVRQIPGDSMLHPDEPAQMPTIHVVSRKDQEIYELEQVFNHLMIRLRESTTNEITLREGTLHAQLNALQMQINPHFIYNTLNIISAKSMESGNFEVIEICDQFAQMLRYSTDTRSRTATMAQEIENVRNYLLLAKARYENNLEFTINVPENLNEILVPKLTLQPLVENALTHGFDGKNELRKLSVTGHIENDSLILEIRDNGTGFSEEMLHTLRERIQKIEEGKGSLEAIEGHIGLVNTCLRLHYYSQGKVHVSIRNEDGAVITITLPCETTAIS